jgi:hypothetical protein
VPNGPNLFARLHKWAARQDENFLTESLAVVLEHLLILASEIGVRMVSRLTGGFIELTPENASVIEIHTQVETGSGRPDLEIGTPQRLVWIEVKVESELRTGQLEGYRVLLRERGAEQTRLILLTRYPENFQNEETRPDLEIRWFELADWLEIELPAVETVHEVAAFLARQFLDFLRGRNMNLMQVGKFMPEGFRDLASLLDMLFEAAAACKVTAKKAVYWEPTWSLGINLEGKKYWFGVRSDEPGTLWFGTYQCRIDPEKGSRLDGEVVEDKTVPGSYRWWRGMELNSESVHFFARSKVGQMRWLEGFLRECLTMAHSIETPEQPPIPEEPEES